MILCYNPSYFDDFFFAKSVFYFILENRAESEEVPRMSSCEKMNFLSARSAVCLLPKQPPLNIIADLTILITMYFLFLQGFRYVYGQIS